VFSVNILETVYKIGPMAHGYYGSLTYISIRSIRVGSDYLECP